MFYARYGIWDGGGLLFENQIILEYNAGKKVTIFLVFNIMYDIRIDLLLFTAIDLSNTVDFFIFLGIII